MNANAPVDSGSGSAERRMHRSSTERVVAGVCGGIAEYFSVDPSLVRIAFVVGTLWGGLGVLLYIVLWVILPVDYEAATYAVSSTGRSHALAGTVLIVLGALLLTSNMGWAPWLTWNVFWPVMLIVIGVGFLARGPRGGTTNV